MSENSAIEWTDMTWNVGNGCEVVSPGCANCYAMRFAGRFSKPGQRYHGLVTIGKNKRAIWTGETSFSSEMLAKPLTIRKPKKIFVNSMSDLFYEKFTNEQIAAVFGVMAACPQHTFQVLTKRAKRMREWFEWVAEKSALRATAEGVPGSTDPWWKVLVCLDAAETFLGYAPPGGGSATWPLHNVWLGVSVENQEMAGSRIPELLRAPAAMRFLSMEPLLEKVRINEWTARETGLNLVGAPRGLSWVIVGCESGPKARPCEVDWVRAIRDQCAVAGAPLFVKQAVDDVNGCTTGTGSGRKARNVISLPYIDGVQHAQFPEVTA